jgi:hypothetical protein
MIRHIVFFTAKSPDDRSTVFQGLKLLENIKECRHIEIGENLNSDPISPEGPDFIVYAEFDDAEQLAAYKADPLYAESIRIVRPLRDMRIAADFFT